MMKAKDGVDILTVSRRLTGRPIGLTQALTQLPGESGLYAWWAARTVLPELPGLANAEDEALRLLYVGLAANLRRRIAGNHLKRSGSSTLRRTLAGLLISEQSYRTMWTDRVVWCVRTSSG